MTKLTILNIFGQPNGILNLKKVFDKTLKKYTSCKRGLHEDYLELYENRADNPRSNLRSHEISILIFFPILLQNKQ